MSGVLIDLARTFAALSLVSIGGINVLLPDVRRQVVDVHGWMTDPAFATTFAIASASPGPNTIIISLVGWQVAGAAGLVVATLAILLPSSLLAWVAARGLARWSHLALVATVKAAWLPLGLGLMLASGVTMVRIASRDWLLLVIALASALFVYASRRNPVWTFAGAAAAGILALHLA